jgi:hypothetical protein
MFARNTMNEKIVSERRTMILEMMMAEPLENWTYQRIAERARLLPWFAEHMPNYSNMTAYRDLLAVTEETKENREKLAEGILVRQLDQTDVQIQGLLHDLEELGSLGDFLEENDGDDGITINDINTYVKAKDTLLKALDRLMAKQADLVPINIPKKVEIDQTRFSFDYYLEVHKQHAHELDAPKLRISDGNTVEGEYEEQAID